MGRFYLTSNKIKVRLAAPDLQGPPPLGSIANEVYQVMSDKFNAIPPNLRLDFQQDGSAVIAAADPTSGMNVIITIKDNGSATPQTGPTLGQPTQPLNQPPAQPTLT